MYLFRFLETMMEKETNDKNNELKVNNIANNSDNKQIKSDLKEDLPSNLTRVNKDFSKEATHQEVAGSSNLQQSESMSKTKPNDLIQNPALILEPVRGLFSKDGDTFLCFHNKEQKTFKLKDIEHPNKATTQARAANKFINDNLKKKNLFVVFHGEDNMDREVVTVYLDKNHTKSFNQMMIEQNLHENKSSFNTMPDEPKNIAPTSLDQSEVKTILPAQEISTLTTNDNTEKLVKSTKGEMAYVLFSKDGESFLGMHNDTKKTFKLKDINHPDTKTYQARAANKFINEQIKQKRVFLEIHEEDGQQREVVTVYLDKNHTQSLNQMMIDKKLHENQKTTIKKADIEAPQVLENKCEEQVNLHESAFVNVEHDDLPVWENNVPPSEENWIPSTEDMPVESYEYYNNYEPVNNFHELETNPHEKNLDNRHEVDTSSVNEHDDFMDTLLNALPNSPDNSIQKTNDIKLQNSEKSSDNGYQENEVTTLNNTEKKEEPKIKKLKFGK